MKNFELSHFISKLKAFHSEASLSLIRKKSIEKFSPYSSDQLIYLLKEDAEKFLVLWYATVVFMWGYVALSYYSFESNGIGHVGFALSIIHSALPLLLRLTQNIKLIVFLLSISALIFQIVFSYFSGGISSFILIWFSIHPILYALFTPPSYIIGSVALNFFSIIGLWFIQISGNLPKSIFIMDFHGPMLITSHLGLELLLALFAIIGIKSHLSQKKEITNSKNKIENLVAILGHDITNPLGVIILSSNMANEGKNINENLARIKKAAKQVQEITDSVRIWMSYSNGKILLRKETLTTEEILDHLHFTFSSRLKDKDLQLKIIDHDPTLTMIGDKSAVLYQVFSNILSNAIKYSHRGSNIDFTSHQIGSFVEITIRDHGIGIDLELLKNVFSAYTKTSTKGTAKENGSGFGLPILKSLVDDMEGKVRIENTGLLTGDSGTLIIISLPYCSPVYHIEKMRRSGSF